MSSRNEGNLLIANAHIIFRNFRGLEGPYNREGDRNFCVLLDHANASAMAEDGWNVKALRAREEGDPDQPYLEVAVSDKYRQPRVVLISNGGRSRTELRDFEMIGILDEVDAAYIDLSIRPYNWSRNGRSGIKAYLKAIFVTLEEDRFDQKYNQIPEVGSGVPAIEAGRDYDDDNTIDGEIVEERLAIGR